MTLIVGIRCRNGVVVAADSAATVGDGLHYTIGQQQVRKVHDLGSAGLFAATGSIGAAQQVCNGLRRLVGSGQLCNRSIETPEDAMRLIGSCVGETVAPLFEQARNAVPVIGNQRAGENVLCKSLVAVAATSARTPILCQIAESGAPEMVMANLCFAAMGSGQGIADPFLALLKRILWADREPELNEGLFAAPAATQTPPPVATPNSST